MPEPLPVAQLLRVSTAGQADRLGLPAQEHANGETARRFGLEIVDTVRIVMSGAEVATSPGMERLLSLVEAGEARGVVVAQYDRLFRPERWSDMLVLQRLKDAGAAIWTPAGEIDLSTDLGHMQATVYNLIAAQERRNIVRRMAAGREEKRRRGAHVGFKHSIPLGLDWTEEAGWAYTPEAAIIAECFRLFLSAAPAERSCEAIAEAVGLGRTTVRYVLQNEAYTGWRVYDMKRGTERLPHGGKRKVKRAPHELLRVRLSAADGTPLPPLVSADDIELARRYLEEGRLQSARANARTEGQFVYRGTLYCATPGCGCGFYHSAGSKRKDGTYKRFYHCKTLNPRYGPSCGAHNMSEHLLDPVIDAALAGALTDRATLCRALAAHRDHMPATVAPDGPGTALDTSSLTRRIEERRQRVLDAFVDGALTREERDGRLAKLDTERQRLEAAIPEPPERDGLHRAVSASDVVRVVRVFRRFHRLDFDAKRTILEAVRPRLFVGHYDVAGVWLDGRLFGDQSGGDAVSPLKRGASRSPAPASASSSPPASCSSRR